MIFILNSRDCRSPLFDPVFKIPRSLFGAQAWILLFSLHLQPTILKFLFAVATSNHPTTLRNCHHVDTKCKLQTQLLYSVSSLPSITLNLHFLSISVSAKLDWSIIWILLWIKYGNDNILPRIRREGENL